MKRFFPALLAIILLTTSCCALKSFSANHINIDSEIDDDVFLSGGEVNVNAPVSSLVIAGGIVNINAPVNGDVFVAAGQLNINAQVSGKLVCACGQIEINQNITTNMIAAGGRIIIGKNASIGKDALLSAGSVENNGDIRGDLTVRSGDFQGEGTAGNLDFERIESIVDITTILTIFDILLTTGFLLLGLVLLKLFPRQFKRVAEEIAHAPVKNTVTGFAMIVLTTLTITLFAISLIGIPLAAITGVVFIAKVIVSSILVSYAVGINILTRMKKDISDSMAFVFGYLLINLGTRMPHIGGPINLITLSLGFSSLFYISYADYKKNRTKKKNNK